MQFKIALPKGHLLGETSSLLSRAGWGLDDYKEGTRAYRLKSQAFPGLFAKVFQERDIPIQVAVGNYDLGICGLDWIEELLAKYPDSDLIKLRDLGYGNGSLYAAASAALAAPQLDTIKNNRNVIRLASEYPNLTESFALDLRLKRFSVFPLWGAAEAYPPENADIVMVSRKAAERSLGQGLVSVSRVLGYSAYLIANKGSWENKDLSKALASIESLLRPPYGKKEGLPETMIQLDSGSMPENKPAGEETIRLALADGHQQEPTIELLTKAGVLEKSAPAKE